MITIDENVKLAVVSGFSLVHRDKGVYMCVAEEITRFAHAIQDAERRTPKPSNFPSTKTELINSTRAYIAFNNLLSHIGMEGEVDSRSPFVTEAMDALHEIDGGVFLSKRLQEE